MSVPAVGVLMFAVCEVNICPVDRNNVSTVQKVTLPYDHNDFFKPCSSNSSGAQHTVINSQSESYFTTARIEKLM